MWMKMTNRPLINVAASSAGLAVAFGAFLLSFGVQTVFADIHVKRLFKTQNEVLSVRHYSSVYVRGTPLLLREGMGGWLIYASPDTSACSLRLLPPSFPRKLNSAGHVKANASMPWILMASAGNCSLAQKMSMASKLGFAALIIHSAGKTKASSLSVSHLPLSPPLYVVAIDEDTAVSLRDNYTFFNGKGHYVVYISEASSESWFEASFSPFFHTLSAICCAITVFILVRRFRESWSNRHKKGIGLKNVNAIPTREFSADDTFEVCVICFENFETGETLRVLPCEHMFHPACIDPWLSKRRNACPVCKRKAWRRPETRAKKAAALKPGQVLAEEEEDEEEDISEDLFDDVSEDYSTDALPETVRVVV